MPSQRAEELRQTGNGTINQTTLFLAAEKRYASACRGDAIPIGFKEKA
jgi:hypothetical protein